MLAFQLLHSTDNADRLTTTLGLAESCVEPSFSFPGPRKVVGHQAQAIHGRHDFGNSRTLCPIVQFRGTYTNRHGELQVTACLIF